MTCIILANVFPRHFNRGWFSIQAGSPVIREAVLVAFFVFVFKFGPSVWSSWNVVKARSIADVVRHLVVVLIGTCSQASVRKSAKSRSTGYPEVIWVNILGFLMKLLELGQFSSSTTKLSFESTLHKSCTSRS